MRTPLNLTRKSHSEMPKQARVKIHSLQGSTGEHRSIMASSHNNLNSPRTMLLASRLSKVKHQRTLVNHNSRLWVIFSTSEVQHLKIRRSRRRQTISITSWLALIRMQAAFPERSRRLTRMMETMAGTLLTTTMPQR